MTKSLVLCALLASPALAQFQAVVNAPASRPASTIPGDPRFELFTDLPAPLPNIVPGYTNVTNLAQNASTGHRYFYDESTHIYFGYDVVIQPEQPIDTYRVSFYDLSIGPLDLPTTSQGSPDPSLWKKLPLPALPEPKVMQASENLPVNVFVDSKTGAALVDNLRIVPIPDNLRRYASDGAQIWQVLRTAMNRSAAATPARYATGISGDAREFSAGDAEMRLQTGRVIINGTAQPYVDPTRSATGALVWFYVPGHGRYILSLTARPDLSFVKAGEIRGGLVTFTVDQDQVLMQSPTVIAPGDSAYTLYVLHDPDWAPTSTRQTAIPLSGSVSPGELAALARH